MNRYNDLKKYNDYELLYLINEGSEQALNILFAKYDTYIIKIVSNYMDQRNENFDDLVQEGRLVLYKCVKTYKDDNNASFFGYFTFIFRRKIVKLINEINNLPILNEDLTLYNTAIEAKSELSGKMFFKDKIKINFFDCCIIGKMTIMDFSKKNNLTYDQVYYLNKKIIEELKQILGTK